jgi:hypothetical protein
MVHMLVNAVALGCPALIATSRLRASHRGSQEVLSAMADRGWSRRLTRTLHLFQTNQFPESPNLGD